ncbi:MAG: hypothetical protein KKB31_03955 [Nanoarchaeota archaeon]|nr:hypothetical protein [Nanoarchaeota archaeon]
MAIKLEKINLNKVENCNHPEINTRCSYLARINGGWYAGKFSRQWYGLNFDNWGCSGIQLDSDRLQELYRIRGK